MEEKWIQSWAKAKAFEATPLLGKPKFFLTFPYPYMNAFLHIGHFYTIMRVEALARFKRLQGNQVLFPQGYHCTGSPIESAAQRIREKEPKQLEIMKLMGFTDEEIPKFAEPKAWVDFFPGEAQKDLTRLGFSIDFRRSFITTDLNPYYDQFIKWQFNHLAKKGLIVKGKHPVVWCPKDSGPVPDHSRSEGEGETPQEFTLLKYPLGNEFLIAATLRPETVFGQTNLWVNPSVQYVRAIVDGETWIASRPFFEKLSHQEHQIQIKGNVSGTELLGKVVEAPMIKRMIPVLPANFCKPDKGTGIVTSVPADAPDDYIGLRDLQQNKSIAASFNLDQKMIEAIKPIAIIQSSDLGDMAAVKVVTDMKIKNQDERDLLEEAKKLVYKKGFYEGIMGKACGIYAGLPVAKAKDQVKKELMDQKRAEAYYELTGPVVCRCLTPSVVKIVSNQWFLNYSNPDWKKECHEALDQIRLYPETARTQFNYVIDWLNDWPCTREFGLGTRLPIDEDWVIESLSDSTIYMAYYTIAHKITKIPIEQINDAFFDHVFLDEKSNDLKVDSKLVQELRDEFNYWYPLDFRNSGKDLIQNHLTFFLFNHTAIWKDKAKWPKGIGVNGWVTVNGEKMSKSKGNFILLREMPERFGTDASRFTILSGGEGMDDANFDFSMANSIKPKIEQWFDFCVEWKGKGTDRYHSIDQWFESEIVQLTKNTRQLMDDALFKSALQMGFFEFQRVMKWYLRRTGMQPNQKLFTRAIQLQIELLNPVMPFITEELAHKLGQSTMLAQSIFSPIDESKINPALNEAEQYVEKVMEDVRQIQNVAKINKPKQIVLYTAPSWKWKGLEIAIQASQDRPDFGAVMKALTSDAELKEHGAQLPNFAKTAAKIAKEMNGRKKLDELNILNENKSFLSTEFNCEIIIEEADQATIDPAKKAQNAFPLKPAIYLE